MIHIVLFCVIINAYELVLGGMMEKFKKNSLIFIGLITFVMLLCFAFYLGENSKVETVCAATEITSDLTSWSGEMTCNEDVTISSSVTVSSANSTLYIAAGKTLTLEDGMTILRSLTINGPGTLQISKADTDSNSGALVINANASLTLEDGRVL